MACWGLASLISRVFRLLSRPQEWPKFCVIRQSLPTLRSPYRRSHIIPPF
jgi:hypothetical protein